MNILKVFIKRFDWHQRGMANLQQLHYGKASHGHFRQQLKGENIKKHCQLIAGCLDSQVLFFLKTSYWYMNCKKVAAEISNTNVTCFASTSFKKKFKDKNALEGLMEKIYFLLIWK